MPSLYLVLYFIYFRRFGTGVPKGAVSLTLEMGKLHQSDVQEYLLSVKQIKIIFGQSSGLTCLLDKVLPLLFGEVFQVRYSGYMTRVNSVIDFRWY